MRLEECKRRTYLSTVVTGTGALAGCFSEGETSDDEPSDNDTSDDEISNDGNENGDGDGKAGEDDPSTEEQGSYHISPDGSDSNSGSESEPLETVHEGLKRAQPGDSIEVTSGEYFEDHAPGEPLRTVRDGRPDAPITITGPEDAILRPSLRIKHSHIRLTGLTLEGLVDPDNRDDPDSYMGYPVGIQPMPDSEEYIEDIVCAPAAVGYAPHALIRVLRTKNLEIGPLRVSGLAGASWVLNQEPNRHAGEIIYLGAPPGMYDNEEYPWSGIDRTRNVHVHHIDNSEGHPHSELVDAKVGTENILVEYCTDGGGSQNTESYPPVSVILDGYNSTVRWCDLRDGDGYAVSLTEDGEVVNERFGIDIPDEVIGTDHSVYGNQVSGFEEEDLKLVFTEPGDQKVLCENEMSGIAAIGHDHPWRVVDYDLNQSCSSDVPEGDGIGHTGGDSPWT